MPEFKLLHVMKRKNKKHQCPVKTHACYVIHENNYSIDNRIKIYTLVYLDTSKKELYVALSSSAGAEISYRNKGIPMKPASRPPATAILASGDFESLPFENSTIPTAYIG